MYVVSDEWVFGVVVSISCSIMLHGSAGFHLLATNVYALLIRISVVYTCCKILMCLFGNQL